MHKMGFIWSLALAGLPMFASAALITSATSAPTDYLDDAYAATASTKTYAVSTTIASGQSFTHTTDDGDSWLFSSITFKSYDTAGTTASAGDFTLSIYLGESLDAEDLLGSFTFDDGEFDSTANTYMTFELTDAESAELGELTSGTTYTVVLSSTGDSLALMRAKVDSYDAGSGLYNGTFQSGTDATFWVTAAIPEPATIGMLGIGMVGLLFVRRKIK